MLTANDLGPLVLVLAGCGGAAPSPPFATPSASASSAAPAPSPMTPSPLPQVAADSAPSVLTAEEIARDAVLAPKANAFLNAFTNGLGHLTRAGAVVFVSNRDGLPQLYVGDAAHPKEPPRRLPTAKERVGGVTLTSDERSVLFASDVGADGNFHIFRIGLDGTGLTDLTPGEAMHRDRAIVARSAPGLFAYSGHAASSEKTRVLLQRLDGSPPREVYADPHGGVLADLAPDGKHALFLRENSDEDDVLFDVDTASHRATRIYPPEGKPAAVDGTYSATADRVFVSTQVEGAHAEVLAIDRASGKTVARYEETALPNGSIQDVVVSPTGKEIAIGIDGGNHSELRLLDARTLKLERTVETPLGAAFFSAFTEDGKRITLSESRPDMPGEIFVADVSSGVVTPLRDETRAELAAMAPIKASIEPIPAADGLSLPTNVYLPADAAPGAKLPTLVVIHGGPSANAYVRWSAPLRFFSSLGYAVVEPNIRGSVGFGVAFQKADDKEKRADALKDVETINAWARAQPWCDSDRLVIMGQSYGGYMTLLALARQPKLWRAGVDVSGMSDLRTMEKLEDQAIRVFDETEFGVLGKEDDLLFEWSPLKYADAIAAPVFVYQGVDDPITPQNEADQIVKALRQRRVPVEYMLLAHEGHGVVRQENNAQYLARAARFLEEHAGAR